MSTNRSASNYGFNDALDDLSDWTPAPAKQRHDGPEPEAIRKVAQKAGFQSREPQKPPARSPDKEVMDQINFRAKASVISAFRSLCSAQEPKWPMGYALERALEALKRELKQ